MTRDKNQQGVGPLAALALCVLLVASGASPAGAQNAHGLQNIQGPLREYLIKAAFLYNFARFTEWPENAFESSTSPIRLCILGKDPFGAALDTIAGKKIRNRPIAIEHLVWAEDAPRCHMLFISASAEGRLDRLFRILDGKPVLTIGETPGVVQAGCVIGLENVDKKFRFRVNVDTARTTGLTLASGLLDLAVIVRAKQAARVIPVGASARTRN